MRRSTQRCLGGYEVLILRFWCLALVPQAPNPFCSRYRPMRHPLQGGRRSWASALKKAGLPFFHICSLRHTFASRLNAAGVSPLTVAQMLGHASPGIANLRASPGQCPQRCDPQAGDVQGVVQPPCRGHSGGAAAGKFRPTRSRLTRSTGARPASVVSSPTSLVRFVRIRPALRT